MLICYITESGESPSQDFVELTQTQLPNTAALTQQTTKRFCVLVIHAYCTLLWCCIPAFFFFKPLCVIINGADFQTALITASNTGIVLKDSLTVTQRECHYTLYTIYKTSTMYFTC